MENIHFPALSHDFPGLSPPDNLHRHRHRSFLYVLCVLTTNKWITVFGEKNRVYVTSPDNTWKNVSLLSRLNAITFAEATIYANTERHILIVDDDTAVLMLLQQVFEQAGYRVTQAANGKQLRALLAKEQPDLVVLDVNLPDDSGFTLAQEIRHRCQAGIIMLTGRSGDVDRLAGLELGADDYITKPFNDRELLTRARNLLRRIPLAGDTNRGTRQQGFRFGQWRFFPYKHLLVTDDGNSMVLTRAESDLLLTLVMRPHLVFSREHLLDAIHGRSANSGARTIDVLILRLRRKLGDDPRSPSFIATVPGTGYYFAHDMEAIGEEAAPAD